MGTKDFWSILLESEDPELPAWIELALSGGSRSQRCCRHCGSYDHGHRECGLFEHLQIDSGLRSGRGYNDNSSQNPYQGSGGAFSGFSPQGGGTGGRGRGRGRGGRGGRDRGGGGDRGGRTDRAGGRGGGNRRGDPDRRGTGIKSKPIEIAEDLDRENTTLQLRWESGSTEHRFPLRTTYTSPDDHGNSWKTTIQVQNVLANYFQFKIKDGNDKIQRYKVETDPKSPPRQLWDTLISRIFPGKELKIVPDYAGYIYISNSVIDDLSNKKCDISSGGTTYSFSFKMKKVLNLEVYKKYIGGEIPTTSDFNDNTQTENNVIPNECNEIVQALNAIILRYPIYNEADRVFQQRGNTLFCVEDTNNLDVAPIEARSLDFGKGGQTLTGYHASVRSGPSSFLINVSKTTNIFYKPTTVLESIGMHLSESKGHTSGTGPLSKDQITEASKFLRGVTLQVDLPGTPVTAKFRRISEHDAINARYEHQGVETSVQKFWEKKCNKILSKPKMQVLSLGSSSSGPGRTGRQDLFPLEVCRVKSGQRFRGKISAAATSTVIQKACVWPYRYIQALHGDFINLFGMKRTSSSFQNETFDSFGITIRTELLQLRAHILPQPMLSLRNNWGKRLEVEPNKKDTSWRVIGQYDTPGRLPRYEIVEFRLSSKDNGVDKEVVSQAIDSIINKCHERGMSGVPPQKNRNPRVNFINLDGSGDGINIKPILTFFQNASARVRGDEKTPIIFCLLPNISPKIYNAVKQGGDIIAGVHTICFQIGKAIHPTASIIENLALKVNLKAGGINQSIQNDGILRSIFEKRTHKRVMLVGADVTHSGNRLLPSITAVVCSVEPSHSRVLAEINFQKNGEMIQSMQEDFGTRLDIFAKLNGALPQSIILFRDGVSESQYLQVMNKEIGAIDKAIKSRYSGTPGSNPRLTVIVVGKRHHTRFFPNADSEEPNTSPGLVVDRGVTAVYERDFFLQAHAAIRGTVRPAHYFVLRDDNMFTETEIQQLSHIWSYSFGRSLRSVSYAPPAYCADLACGRARCWIQHVVEGLPKQAADGEDPDALAQDNLQKIKDSVVANPHQRLKDSMWYI